MAQTITDDVENNLGSAAAMGAMLQQALPDISVVVTAVEPVAIEAKVLSSAEVSLLPADFVGGVAGLGANDDDGDVDIGPVVAGTAGAAVVLLLLVRFHIVRKRRKGKQARHASDQAPKIDPMAASALFDAHGLALQQLPITIAHKPTIQNDGILAVLEYKKVTPIDLRKEITYGMELGSGAFGVVMKCKFRQSDCAVKQLHKESHRAVEMLEGLIEEFDVMMQLRHPNVLLTMGIAVDPDDKTTGIVMELMQASLYDVIYDSSFEPYAKWDSAFFAVMSDVAKGMSFIHFNGLLHRDLKPGNILIDAQWVAKVGDFGNALDDSTVLYEREQQMMGTPPYMAPEIITLHKYEPPVDVWAFGCIIAHVSTRKIPYQQLNMSSKEQMLDVIRSGEVSPLELLFQSESTPKSVMQIAKDCCLPDPSMRPDFTTIAQRFGNMVDDENDPRPLVRIKNKKVARLAIAGHEPGALAASGASGADADDTGAAAPGFHSTYRDKFRRKSGSNSPGSARDYNEPGGSERSTDGGESSTTSEAMELGFMDTFSATLMKTFTPGK